MRLQNTRCQIQSLLSDLFPVEAFGGFYSEAGELPTVFMLRYI